MSDFFDLKKNRSGSYTAPNFAPPQIPLPFIILGAVGILLIVAAFTSAYTIKQDEEGVILRFGRYVQTTQPGLHLKLPFGIDRLHKVKTKTIHKAEFGFRTDLPGIRTRYSAKNYDAESIMLTGDLNVAKVEWVVQFRILDPKKFLFNVKDIANTLRDMSESVVRSIIGDRTVNNVLTVGRLEIEGKVQSKLQNILDKFHSGIKIVTVQLQNINPPDTVKASYNDVNKAKQDKERMINQANEEYNKDIAKARGEAEQLIEKARGYKLNRINRAQGDATRFLSILQEYKKSKAVTKKRLYIETMTEILKNVKSIYVIDHDQRSLLPLFNLNANGVSQ